MVIQQVRYATNNQHKGLDQVINSVEIMWLKSQISVVFYLLPLPISFGFTQSFLKFIERYDEINQS